MPVGFWFNAPGYVVQNSSFLIRQPEVGICYLTLVSLLIVIGTAGNILILGAVYVSKYLKTTGNIFLASLALADLLVASFVNIFNIIAVVLGEAWFVQYPRLCEFVACVCLLACYCSLFSLGAVSFNRYIHICHYEYYRRIFTLRNSILIAIGIWTLGFLADLPNFFGWGGFGYHQRTEMCVFNYRQSLSYSFFAALVGVGLPWILISMSYILIFYYVHQNNKRVKSVAVKYDNAGKELDEKAAGMGKGAPQASRHTRESLKLARTFFLLFLFFTVCWTPFALIVMFQFADGASQTIDMFFVMIAHANSSVNVLLYGVSNSHFRAGYARFLRLDRLWPRLKQANGFRHSRRSVGKIRPADNVGDKEQDSDTITREQALDKVPH